MKRLLLVTLLGYMFISLFGMNITMTMHEHGKMTNCPFMMNNSSICQMGAGEHIQKWQEMFTAVLSNSTFLIYLAIVAFIAFSVFLSQCTLGPPLEAVFKQYRKEHPDIGLFNPLLLAFSDGILHPRIYA